jgi:hypothetical protein
MSVTIGASPKVQDQVVRFTLLKAGNILADGSEQTLVDFGGLGRVSGYVNLMNMNAGDEVRIRQYMIVNGAYNKYADEAYKDKQAVPVVYVTPKESDRGLRVTLQQTAGILRNYENRFILEE